MSAKFECLHTFIPIPTGSAFTIVRWCKECGTVIVTSTLPKDTAPITYTPETMR